MTVSGLNTTPQTIHHLAHCFHSCSGRFRCQMAQTGTPMETTSHPQLSPLPIEANHFVLTQKTLRHRNRCITTHFSPISEPFQRRNIPCQLFQLETTSMRTGHLPASVSTCPDTSRLEIEPIPLEGGPHTAVQRKILSPQAPHSLPFVGVASAVIQGKEGLHLCIHRHSTPTMPPSAFVAIQRGCYLCHPNICVCCRSNPLNARRGLSPQHPPLFYASHPLCIHCHSTRGGDGHPLLSVRYSSTQVIASPLHPPSFDTSHPLPFLGFSGHHHDQYPPTNCQNRA